MHSTHASGPACYSFPWKDPHFERRLYWLLVAQVQRSKEVRVSIDHGQGVTAVQGSQLHVRTSCDMKTKASGSCWGSCLTLLGCVGDSRCRQALLSGRTPFHVRMSLTYWSAMCSSTRSHIQQLFLILVTWFLKMTSTSPSDNGLSGQKGTHAR